MTAEFDSDTRDAIYARAGGYCELWLDRCCTRGQTAEIHHRRPRGMGGSRRQIVRGAANGLLACRPCHEYVESHREWAREMGFLVSQTAVPAEQPVWWRSKWTRNNVGMWKRQWCFLDDAGGRTEITLV